MKYISMVTQEMQSEFYKQYWAPRIEKREQKEKVSSGSIEKNNEGKKGIHTYIEEYINDIEDIQDMVVLYDKNKFYSESVFKDNSMCLDISEINDNLSKTLLYYIIPVFNVFKRDKNNISNIAKIIHEHLPEGKKIIRMLENRICLLFYVSCVNDKGNVICIRDTFGLYNPSIVLIHLAKIDEDIKNISSIRDIDVRTNNYIYIIGIQESITYLNHGLVSVLYENYRYKYSSRSGYAMLNNGYLQDTMHNFRSLYSILSDNLSNELVENNAEIVGMLYEFTKKEIDLKCNSMRLQFAELNYMHSPFIERTRKEDIGRLFDILWKITCDAEIAKVYIEENEYESKKNIELIGRMERTTRVQVIFSLENQDIYSLRIDMPHKGVDYAHINLQEIKDACVKDSAMPILDKELLNEIKELLGGQIKKYFYQAGDEVYWFRINFIDLIEDIEDEKLGGRLREIFEIQKHFRINITNNGYGLFNEFKYYLKMYLSNSVQVSKNIDISAEIIKYRCVLWARDMFETCLVNLFNKTEYIIDMYISKIKKEMKKIWDFFSEEEIDKLYWFDVLELLLADFYDVE